jgi:hypothetical protein
MTPRDQWKWYGYPGHLCVGHKCAFHLSTRIGKYLISTVGDYRKVDGDGLPQEIGSGRLFETFVFPCDGETEFGDPANDLNSIDSECYNDSKKAEDGHYEMCYKWAQKQ